MNPPQENAHPTTRPRLLASGLILVSLAFALLVLAFFAALHATPEHLVDSLGHPMGFNDPLSFEHYAIIASHVSLTQMVAHLSAYHWVLLMMHPLALLVVWRAVLRKQLTYFALLQFLLFPLGLLGLPFLIGIPFYALQQQADRETFLDGPIVEALTQPFWLLTLALAIRMLWPHLPSAPAQTVQRDAAPTPKQRPRSKPMAQVQGPAQRLVVQLEAPAQNLVYVLEARRRDLETRGG